MKPHKHDMRMKRFLQFALLLISAIVLLASCEKAPFITMTGPRTFNFTRDGGTQSVSFTCNRPWSVSSTESWIQITPSSGEASDKDITVTIKCSPNTTYDPRSATVTVKLEELSESITITQDTGIGLLVSPTTFELTNAAQVIEIEVQKNVQYSVAIDNESAKWIKQGGTKALTTDKVTFTISANESYDNREGKITFKQLDGDLSQTVTIRQSQTNGLFITTPDYNLSNEAHTLSVEVKANVEFEVTSQTEWIKYVETKALTPSTITLSVEANESYDNRTGTVLVKQKNGDLTGTITVSQKQTDFLHTPSTSFNLTSEAQNITLEIQDNVSYSIVIPDDAKDWISVSSNTQTKALVDDVVVLAIAANTTYGERSASVTIKQTDGSLAGTVEIKQAQNDGLFVDKTSYELSSEAQSLDIKVDANVEFEVSSNVDWIEYIETKALSNSTVCITIKENKSYSIREGKVEFVQKNGSLKQTITINQLPSGLVNLGLSVYWASCNLCNNGLVSSPEKFGDYYAWGETTPYYEDGYAQSDSPVWRDGKSSGYQWESYQWCTALYNSYTKYNSNSSQGVVDNKTVLEAIDDAAQVKLGGKWRMPTDAEWTELRTNCTWTWTNDYNGTGIAGEIVTSNKAGYTNKSIFLPAASSWGGTTFLGWQEGVYWSSTQNVNDAALAKVHDFLSSITLSFHLRI